MNVKEAQELRAAIRRLVKAEVADSWAGAGDPEDGPAIRNERRIASRRVLALITKLTVK